MSYIPDRRAAVGTKRTRAVALALVASLTALLGTTPAAAQVAGDSFTIAYGETVSEGVPAPGAGNIEVGGSVDTYRFDGVAGDVAIFDAVSPGAGSFRWTLEAPGGAVVFDALWADRSETLAETGTYTLTVYGSTATTVGAYSLRLLLTPPPQDFAIAIGDTVSDGVPGHGAGNIEVPGAIDRYTFDGSAGQVVIFDALTGPTSGLRLIVAAPDGTELVNVIYTDRELVLPAAGTYTVEVQGLFLTSVGAYSFQLVDAPPRVDEFVVAIGDAVSDGVPGPGAGNVEGPGALDRYLFDGAAGQDIAFDTSSAPVSGLHWTLVAPDGAEVFARIFADTRATLDQSGTYTLQVRGLTVTSFGTYSFRLAEAPQNTAPVAVDDSAETEADTPVIVDVLANDHDLDGDPLTVDAVTEPGNGSATTDGHRVTYTPASGFNGVDTFTYAISDGRGGTASATVTVTVLPAPNRPPTIADVPDQANTVGDSVTLSLDAHDPDGDALAYAAVGLPTGLGIHPASGEITGTIADGADVDSPFAVIVTATDPHGDTASTGFQWTVLPLPDDDPVVGVDVDVLMPCFFVNGYGVIPVVVYGNDQVDARRIDLSTVRLEGMGVRRVLRWYAAVVADVNHDGIADVLVLIDEVRGAIPAGTTTATLTGRLADGTAFAGTDDVCVRS